MIGQYERVNVTKLKLWYPKTDGGRKQARYPHSATGTPPVVSSLLKGKLFYEIALVEVWYCMNFWLYSCWL